MYDVINDRIFWIYVIIAFFFIIIGMGLIILSDDPNLISITILWLIGVLALTINSYYLYIENDNCLKFFIIVVFIILLIISVIWAGELWNSNSQLLLILCTLILLGGVVLIGLRTNGDSINTITYWSSIIFITIWLALTLHIIT